jgi:hypothetical protein
VWRRRSFGFLGFWVFDLFVEFVLVVGGDGTEVQRRQGFWLWGGDQMQRRQ